MNDQPNVNTPAVVSAGGNFLVAWDWDAVTVWRTPDGSLVCDEREVRALVAQNLGRFVAWHTATDGDRLRGARTRQTRPVVFRLSRPDWIFTHYTIQVKHGPRSWRRGFARAWMRRGNVVALNETEALHVATLAGIIFVDRTHARAVRMTNLEFSGR